VVVSRAVREQVQALLPGERIEYLLPAVIPGNISANVYVVVTARCFTVLSVAFSSRSRPRRVIARYPRNTPVGEPERNGGVPGFTLGGRLYEVDDADLAIVSALHRASSGQADLPPDPLG